VGILSRTVREEVSSAARPMGARMSPIVQKPKRVESQEEPTKAAPRPARLKAACSEVVATRPRPPAVTSGNRAV